MPQARTHRPVRCISWLLLFLAPATASAGEQHDPVATGIDRAVTETAVQERLHSLLVSQGGVLRVERYFNGRRREDLANVKSVSKSILSALVGIAIERGELDGVGVTLGRYLGKALERAGDPSKSSITIENLLTMQAGLRSTSNGHYGAWIASDNWVETALQAPLEALPGREMTYSTGNTHLLSAVLTGATARSTLDFAQVHLAGPMGFVLAPWPRDPQGIYFGGNDMELTPRQMLAFGELYLNQGRAGDRQIVPAWWVDQSLLPRARSPHGDARYYGYGWWICTLAGYEAPHAWGYGGQFIMLVPDLDLAIVTTSSTEVGPAAHEHANRVYALLQQVIRIAAREATLRGLYAGR